MPNKLEKNASKTTRNPGSGPSNIDVERLLEITRQAVILEHEVDTLKEEIDSLQNEINSNKEALGKIGDKRKSDYKALDNRIGLGIRLIKDKREELNEKQKELRKANGILTNISNISASKNVPPRANEEDVKNKELNNLQAKAKKLAEDFDNEEKRNDFTDEDRKIINTEIFKNELKKVRLKNQTVENLRRRIAEKEIDNIDLSTDEQIEKDILLFNEGEKEKIEKIKEDITKKRKEKTTAEEDAKNLEAEEKANQEKIKQDIDRIAEKIATGAALSGAEKMQLKKYETEIIDLAKSKTEQNKADADMRESIITAENEGKELTIEQKAFVNRPGERFGIDSEKTKRQTEAAAAKAKADADAAIAKSKAEREAFGKLDRAGKRAKAMERYQKMAEKVFEKKTVDGVEETDVEQEARISNFQRQSQEKRDRANVRREGGYAKATKEYQDIIGNAEYIKLKKDAAHLGPNQKAILAQYEERLNNAKKKAEQTGPLGSTYIDLESARRELAKASQEYKHSFKRKFIGSRALAGISNMFGFKYSGIKEGDHTKEAHHHLEEAQAKYDNLRQKIMQGTLAEDYDVNKIVKFNDASLAQRMQAMVEVADKKLIVSEHEKLEDMKHVLEDTVKKPAFLQFAKWYKNNYYGFIKNERARRVAQRVTNALVLSGAMWATGGIAGLAVGVAGGRALLSGTIGESAAAGVAGLFGGTKNKRGEFEKFAAKRDNERLEAATLMSRAIYEQVAAGNKPDVSRPIFRDRVVRDEKANVNMQMREMRLRKGEMWTRLLVGGGLGGYLIHEALPHPMPGPGPGPIPVPPKPGIDDFKLEGDFVDASSRGAIQTFMNLKKEMIAHYKGIDAGQFKYGEANEFAGLTDDQVVEKLLATGKFDKFTTDIMSAHSLKDFMNVAEQHGFWKPEGWHNANIDSASIPAGSKVGMDIGTDGMMHYKIILPDGKAINVDDNFQEALNQHLKGVKMIDSDHLGSRGGHGGGHSIDNTPAPAPANAGDGLGGGDNAPGDDFVPGPSVGGNIDGATNLNTLDQLIAKYKGVGNPGSEHEYLTSHGYGWSGKQGYGPVKSSNDMATEYYDAQRVNKYLTPNDSRYNDIPPGGTLPGYPNIHRIDDLALHKQWQMAHKSYEDAQTEIIKLENVKRQYETDALNAKMYPNRPAGATNTIDQAALDKARYIDEARVRGNQMLVNKHFTEGNKAGTNTDEWYDFKNDKMSEHIRGNVNDDAYGSDDKIRFSGSRDERKFLNDLYKIGLDYKIEPRADETVEQYLDRVSLARAKAEII